MCMDAPGSLRQFPLQVFCHAGPILKTHRRSQQFSAGAGLKDALA